MDTKCDLTASLIYRISGIEVMASFAQFPYLAATRATLPCHRY